MPCQSDYLASSGIEKAISQVACLLDELDGQKKINQDHWRGYHPRVYNKNLSKAEEDKMVATLCSRLQQVSDVTKYSLEMQMWWRDHKIADAERIREEAKRKRTAKARSAALAKLTPAERKLLGLKK